MAFKIVLFLILSLTSAVIANGDGLVESNGSLVECWNALVEIKSCSNEIVLFFLNGHTDIGTDCCRSIAIITRNCWPAMLTSIGFTAEQGYILRGYCDNSASPSTSDAPAAAPSPVVAASPMQHFSTNIISHDPWFAYFKAYIAWKPVKSFRFRL
ncbi:egg cell-secreted protein 1.4-like [Mercurialis annua]|uniref:egg cell-secreted protein 1.4-like n=1 Tax=Mercurialis annua TaxID=3986 RepID=UPI00216092B2|nr:egg cell-secreted protein 1.4-like [Mercurialis annua]